jgi:hypothetical protein
MQLFLLLEDFFNEVLVVFNYFVWIGRHTISPLIG